MEWIFKGEKVLPLGAYTSIDAWLSSFEHQFKDIAVKMHKYSKDKDWNKYQHIKNWSYVLIRKFNKLNKE